MSNYQLTVGLEIHVEVSTSSKMFCACPNHDYDALPNSNVCPVCLGLPGALPVPNMVAVEKTIALGQALGGKIATQTKWDRKNYFYPDLPKGYQISQFDKPIVEGGYVSVGADTIALTRIHLEEDTGKSIHPANQHVSLIDLNRAGAPLIEMVSEPQIHSAQVAKNFCQEFQKILRHLDISNADMEKGQMRCEANISVAKTGAQEMGTKVEVKNLNSFKSVERAIEYEFKRQSDLLDSGGEVVQETRGWSQDKQMTYAQRTKESAHDYRYFSEPDIPAIDISSLTLEVKQGAQSQLPSELRKELQSRYQLNEHESEHLVKDQALNKYFLDTVNELEGEGVAARTIASWMIHSKFANKLNKSDFCTLLKAVKSGRINDTKAREIAQELLSGGQLDLLLSDHRQLDQSAIIEMIKDLLENHPQAVSDYHGGKQQALQFLFGQLMKQSSGRLDPAKARELLIKELK